MKSPAISAPGHELTSVKFVFGGYLECSCGQFRPEGEADWAKHIESVSETPVAGLEES